MGNRAYLRQLFLNSLGIFRVVLRVISCKIWSDFTKMRAHLRSNYSRRNAHRVNSFDLCDDTVRSSGATQATDNTRTGPFVTRLFGREEG